jgi:hypothetical protein
MSIEKFTMPDGEEVSKVVTRSGVTGYIPASVPMEAVVAMRDSLLKDLGMTLEEFEAKYGPA